MNDDLLGILIFFFAIALVLAFPLLIVCTIFSCVAWSNTKKWKKEKARRGLDSGTQGDIEAETTAFVRNTDDAAGDDDGADSLDLSTDSEDSEEDETDATTTPEARAKAKLQREEDKKPDWHLTTGQKFRKELKRAWKGTGGVEAQKKKEKAERKKMAKAVAIEMARVERRRARKEAKKVNAQIGEGSGSGSGSGNGRGVAEDGLPSYNTAIAKVVSDGKREGEQ